MTEKQQTKSFFKVTGKATRLDKDGAYKEETMSKGKREGDVYRSLRFGVKTSDTNEITVSMFDYEPTKVFLWNSDKKKADSNYKGDSVSFADWEERKDELKAQGFAVLQTRVGLTYGDDGKIKSEGLPSYVASEHIYDHLHNGDTVTIEGEIRYSSYKNNKGETKPQTTYTIKKIFKNYEEANFEDEKFEEISYFEQEFVFVDADDAPDEGRMYITGRTIDFKGNFFDAQFMLNYQDADGKKDEDMVKMATAFKERLAFGDVVTVFGQAQNRVILREVEEVPEDDGDLFAEFGGKKKPKHAETYVAKDYVQEMSIEGVDGLVKEVYTEEDFEVEELLTEDGKTDDEFGGKKKPKGSNPFENKVDEDPFASNSGPIEISDDDLPF